VPENLITVRIRAGVEHVEIVGTLAQVDKLLRPYFKGKKLKIEEENKPPTLGQNVDVLNTKANTGGDDLDLLTFYLKMAPQSQTEQVLAITAFYFLQSPWQLFRLIH
jgi:hypothetical protein